MSDKPQVNVDTTATPPAELVCDDLVVGTGAVAAAGNTVDVHYVGVAWSTGGQFDASWDRGEVFSFPLGKSYVIQGWDQGVAGMAASLGLAGATGGLSLLAQQLLKAAPEKDVCRTALSGAAPGAPGAPATAAPAAQPGAPATLPQALPEALRRIFK